MGLKKKRHTLQRTFASSQNSKRMGSPSRKENFPISRKIRTSRRKIPKTLLLLKKSLAMSVTGMVM